MNPRLSFLLTFLLVWALKTLAQSDLPGHMEGRVIDLYNHPISYAHIINLNKSFGVVADQSGRFVIPASHGDSLLITHVSHLVRIMPARLTPSPSMMPEEIVLLPKIFELKEFVVRYLPKTREEFRHDFVRLKLPERSVAVDLKLPHINTMVYSGPEGGAGIVIKGPIQAIYDQFSKEARSRRKLESELANEVTRQMVQQKYSPQLVISLTGLNDPDSVRAFMNYCRFSDQTILESNQYDLCVEILKCFDMYQRR